MVMPYSFHNTPEDRTVHPCPECGEECDCDSAYSLPGDVEVRTCEHECTRKQKGETMKSNVMIDGIEYAPVKPNGNRAVVVVDRGWIFAGDVTEANGRIRLTRAVWVFRWESIGFAAVIGDPKSSKVEIRKMPTDVDIPTDAEVFRIPVSNDWGL